MVSGRISATSSKFRCMCLIFRCARRRLRGYDTYIMPGRLLTPRTGAAAAARAESRETGVPMGVYRLTIPETVQESLNPNARNGSSSFRSQQQQFLRDYRNSVYSSPKPSRYLEVPLITPSKTWMESPEHGQFDDGSTSSVFTSGSSRTSRTSHATFDDDFLLMDCASRICSIDDVFFPQQAPKRHSSVSYSDMAFRREQRKRLIVVEPSAAMDTQRDTSLAMTLSFRRELDVEDERVDESLALWEDEDTEVDHQTRRKVVNEHPTPHSWHAGDSTGSSGSSRNKKKKKRSSTFFNGLFSGLSISSSRKFRKSVS